jgi:hypothetical protein
MPLVNNFFFKIIILFSSLCLLVSCGAMNFFQKPAGKDKTMPYKHPFSLNAKKVFGEIRNFG